VVDVDAAEALLAWLNGNPFLTAVIIHHDRSSRLADTLLTETGGEKLLVHHLINRLICRLVYQVVTLTLSSYTMTEALAWQILCSLKQEEKNLVHHFNQSIS
jgi:hypothetical protein